MRAKAFFLKLKGMKLLFFVPLIYLLVLFPLTIYALSRAYSLPSLFYEEVSKILLTGIPIVTVFWVALLMRDMIDGEIRELIYPHEIARHSQLPEVLTIIAIYFLLSIPDFLMLRNFLPEYAEDIQNMAVSVFFSTFVLGGLCYFFLFLFGKTLAGIIIPALLYSLSVTIFAYTEWDFTVIFSPYSVVLNLPLYFGILAVVFLAGFIADRKEQIKFRLAHLGSSRSSKQ